MNEAFRTVLLSLLRSKHYKTEKDVEEDLMKLDAHYQALQKENEELKIRAKRIKEIVSEELNWNFIEELLRTTEGEE